MNFVTEAKGPGTAVFVAVIAVISLLMGFFCGCSSGPPKPTTHTAVPSLDVAKEKVSRLRSSIQDAKDGVSRLKARNELIDYKESLIK